jgi:dipeptidyl aminopeptidase/acylaminoacyl peptidase
MVTRTATKAHVSKPFYRSRWFWIPAVILVSLIFIAYFGVSIYGALKFNTYAERVSGYTGNTPAKYGLEFEDVSFKTTHKDGITLRGWWIPNPSSNRALLLIHGRDADRTRLMPVARPLWEKGYNLLVFDMRGMGTSDTDRYYFGDREKNDIVAAFNYVKSKGFDPAHIGIVAHSMGAASSLMAMSIDPEIKVLASYAAYADFARLAEYRIQVDNNLPSFVMPGIFFVSSILYGLDANQTKPELVLPDLKDRRIFLMHGDKDTDIPLDHYQSLLKAGGSNIAESWIIPGSAHAGAYDDEKIRDEYVSRVVAFLDKELAR